MMCSEFATTLVATTKVDLRNALGRLEHESNSQ